MQSCFERSNNTVCLFYGKKLGAHKITTYPAQQKAFLEGDVAELWDYIINQTKMKRTGLSPEKKGSESKIPIYFSEMC